MKDQKVYRVVIVKNGVITWASADFFSTEHGAISDIEQRASDDKKLLGFKIEKHNYHPYGYSEMSEGMCLHGYLYIS